MDRLIYTRHANEQMAKRGILRSDVERIVSTPDVSYVGKDGKMNRVGVLTDGQRVRVVLVDNRVITIMWQY